MKYIISLLLLLPAICMAHDDEQIWQSIQDLKARVEQLENRYGVTTTPRPPASGLAHTRYWLSTASPFEAGSTAEPLRQGMMPMESTIDLKPETYGQNHSGIFNSYSDPSRYPVAAVSIRAQLLLDKPGTYQLFVKPTPPREVGGSGNVELMLEISIADKQVFSMPFSASLSPHRTKIRLPGGLQPLELEIVARSPGFGPSPTQARVFIGLQAEDEISARPVNVYLAPAN